MRTVLLEDPKRQQAGALRLANSVAEVCTRQFFPMYRKLRLGPGWNRTKQHEQRCDYALATHERRPPECKCAGAGFLARINPAGSPALIQPDKKDRTFRSVGIVRDLLGTMAIVILHAYPHPPAAYDTDEVQYLRRVVAMGEMVGNIVCCFFAFECTDLHRPASPAIERGRSLQHFHVYFCKARAPDVYCFCSGQR